MCVYLCLCVNTIAMYSRFSMCLCVRLRAQSNNTENTAHSHATIAFVCIAATQLKHTYTRVRAPLVGYHTPEGDGITIQERE